MKITKYVGVSFLQGKIQIAEVDHKKKITVTALAEVDSAINFEREGATLSAGHPKLSEFTAEIRSLIKHLKISSEYISFALPPDPVFINIIPLDRSLAGKDLHQYLQWEVDQYLPGHSSKDFIIDSHGLPVEHATAQQSFMVAIRRGMAMFLQNIVSELKMNLNIIDIDQFSTEKTLITNYPEILEHDIVLFGLRQNGMDASLIHSGQMTDYRSFLYNGNSDPVKPILEYLKYLKQKENSSPAALLLHGIDVKQNLVVALREKTGIKQTLSLNAFRKIAPSEKLDQEYLKESYRFASAIGLALRTK